MVLTKPLSRFCQLCAAKEGYYKYGTIPNRNNNPLDLRHSPHSIHEGDPNGIGQIDSVSDGWIDAERQAGLWASRGLTLGETIAILAPPGPPDNNDTEGYLEFVLRGFGGLIDADTLMSKVLEIPARA